ncbi:MAG: alpha/beta hydrolase [Betaproteobacteria bacterium]|nr:alpha/beta hydrolase [Betaproteobacteria bacterium]
MPTHRASPDCELHYVVDDYTDPWRKPETVLMLHGNAESGAAWFAWVPHLARHYRVVRPDMRGFGASTPMPRDFPWTLDRICDDYLGLMDALGVKRFHLVAAKIGGTIARYFAARNPARIVTLAVAGTPAPRRGVGPRPELIAEFENKGVEHWARRTMAGRLGSRFPPEGVEWWIRLMGRTAVSTQVGFISTIADSDITDSLRRIRCPTLVITTEKSGLGPVEETRAWQRIIPRSRLLVVPGDSYHVAASDADRCAEETRAFIARVSLSTP